MQKTLSTRSAITKVSSMRFSKVLSVILNSVTGSLSTYRYS